MAPTPILSRKLGDITWGRFKNTYELLDIRALQYSPVSKIHIFQCMGEIFCVEFQRYPLIHVGFLCNIEILRALRFKSSCTFLKRPPDLLHHKQLLRVTLASPYGILQLGKLAFIRVYPIVGRKHSQTISSNSLGLSDTILRHRSVSTLAQVRAGCLTAPSHYLNQCRLLIRKVSSCS